MKLGQIPENVLLRSVSKEIEYRNDIKGGVVSKETCAFFIDEIVSSESKNAYLKELNGAMALYSAANSIYALGGIPEAFNINMLMPHRFSEERLKGIVRELEEVCKELNMSIASFAGEMLNGITETVLSVSAVGKNAKLLSDIAAKKSKSGMSIIATKWIGMAGTCVAALNNREELIKRFPSSYVDEMENLKCLMSLKREAEIVNKINSEAALAGKSDTIICLPVSKGGIYKTLWDLGELCSSGLEVNIKDIPIRQETVELCNYYDVNPYEFYSEGCMTILCDCPDTILDRLHEADVPATVIGKLTEDNDRVIVNDYERKFLTKPCPDEMTKIVLL